MTERDRVRVAWRIMGVAMITAICRISVAEQPSAGENSVPSAVRVMSFNVRFGKADDGPNHWRHRKALVLEGVRQFDPDVMGTQETMGFQADYLKKNLPAYEVHGTSRVPSDRDQEQCAVFYRKSRFEKQDAGHFWLSATPDVPGSKSWDSSLPRMVSWIRLRERTRPQVEFFLFNTHFDHVGLEARFQSAALLRAQIQDIAGDSPVILTGDFNCDEGSLPHQTLLYATDRLRLHDTYREHHPNRDPNGEGTFSQWTGRRQGRRIDWILASPQWRVASAAIDRFGDQGRYPSDHYPVTAALRFAK